MGKVSSDPSGQGPLTGTTATGADPGRGIAGPQQLRSAAHVAKLAGIRSGRAALVGSQTAQEHLAQPLQEWRSICRSINVQPGAVING